eukprot:gene9578-biopygen22735
MADRSGLGRTMNHFVSTWGTSEGHEKCVQLAESPKHAAAGAKKKMGIQLQAPQSFHLSATKCPNAPQFFVAGATKVMHHTQLGACRRGRSVGHPGPPWAGAQWAGRAQGGGGGGGGVQMIRLASGSSLASNDCLGVAVTGGSASGCQMRFPRSHPPDNCTPRIHYPHGLRCPRRGGVFHIRPPRNFVPVALVKIFGRRVDLTLDAGASGRQGETAADADRTRAARQ